jgi:formylglycine-generating enzyme required for sulfatase activity
VKARQDCGVRALAITSYALVAVASASAGDHPGRVVRIDRPPSREVIVPRGKFMMGVSNNESEIDDRVEECKRAYEGGDPIAYSFTTPNNEQTTVCNRYAEELEHMSEHEVMLAAYAIDRDEVAVTDYRACVAAGGCELDPLIDGDQRYVSDGGPMVNVTWFEARDFCHWRGGRLPTEAEWERAARGDDRRPWPWGFAERPADFNHGQPRADVMLKIEHDVDIMGDPDPSDRFAELAPPGSYPWGEGPYGTRDQAGNVAEWTADVRGLSNETLGYVGIDTRINPRRDGRDTDPRVVRGGSWRQPAFLGRTNLRDPWGLYTPGGAHPTYTPQQRFSYVGFRCARSL